MGTGRRYWSGDGDMYHVLSIWLLCIKKRHCTYLLSLFILTPPFFVDYETITNSTNAFLVALYYYQDKSYLINEQFIRHEFLPTGRERRLSRRLGSKMRLKNLKTRVLSVAWYLFRG